MADLIAHARRNCKFADREEDTSHPVIQGRDLKAHVASADARRDLLGLMLGNATTIGLRLFEEIKNRPIARGDCLD